MNIYFDFNDPYISPKGRSVFVILFSVLFIIGGLFFCVGVPLKLVSTHGNEQSPLLAIIIGLIAISIGAGILTYPIWGPRLDQKRQDDLAKYPQQPWLWRQDWATGILPSQLGARLVGLWIFTTLVSIVTLPLGAMVVLKLTSPHEPALWAGLLLPFIGLAFIAFAARDTAQWSRFGKSQLQMKSHPASPGAPIRGVIHIQTQSDPGSRVKLRLICTRHSRASSQGETRMSQSVLWQTTQDVEPICDSNQIQIPVNIQLPADAEPTFDPDWTKIPDFTLESLSTPRSLAISYDVKISWTLECKSSNPWSGDLASFEIPVFRSLKHSVIAPSIV